MVLAVTVGEHARLVVLLRSTVERSVRDDALAVLEVGSPGAQWRLVQGGVACRGLDSVGVLKLFGPAIATRKLAALGDLLVKGTDTANVGHALLLDFRVALLPGGRATDKGLVAHETIGVGAAHDLLARFPRVKVLGDVGLNSNSTGPFDMSLLLSLVTLTVMVLELGEVHLPRVLIGLKMVRVHALIKIHFVIRTISLIKVRPVMKFIKGHLLQCASIILCLWLHISILKIKF